MHTQANPLQPVGELSLKPVAKSGKVNVGRTLVSGKVRYRVNYCENGKRKRILCGSKAEAQVEAARLRGEQSSSGLDGAWARLSPERKAQLLKLADQPVTGNTLETVVAELIAAKTKAGRATQYLTSLRLLLLGFVAGRETLAVAAITVHDVERFLDSKRLAYRSTLRARLSTLFNFCVRRGYLAANPCAQLEAVTYLKPPPRIFTPSEVGKCLGWLREHPRAMGWFVLTTCYGLRPEEAEKTAEAKINFKTGVVIVDEQTTKVRQRRVVERPHRRAHALLRLARRAGAEFPITRQLRRRTVRRLRKVLGWAAWPKDVTRHTAASCWLALTRNADLVAESLGHSVKVLKRDYKALVTPEELKFYLKRRKTLPPKAT